MEQEIVGYARVSTQEQDLKNQRYEILDCASKNDLRVSTWGMATIRANYAVENLQNHAVQQTTLCWTLEKPLKTPSIKVNLVLIDSVSSNN